MCTDKCEGCGLPLDQCYYGGDCLEVRAIYHEQQKEKLRDIEISDIVGKCMSCGTVIDEKYYLCGSCQIEINLE